MNYLSLCQRVQSTYIYIIVCFSNLQNDVATHVYIIGKKQVVLSLTEEELDLYLFPTEELDLYLFPKISLHPKLD